MNRTRYWLHLSFWSALLITLGVILLGAETRGGVMDSRGSARHLLAMAVVIVPLARVVYLRALDAGLRWWAALLAIPACWLCFPLGLLALGVVRTADDRGASSGLTPWWIVPTPFAGVAAGALLSLMLR